MRCALLLAAHVACGFAHGAEERPGPVVPPDFTIEVAAAFPQLRRPIFAHFDDVGRLYVGESSGENLNRQQMLEKKPHWITRLEDTNGDGVFDKAVKFVDGITLPQGMLWYRGSVYCACPPSIWKFTDTNDDGVADVREEILTGFGFNGNACDTHGPFLSPTGRLYIAQGRHGHEFKDKDGKVFSKGKAARIYSCRLDGSDVRVHCGGGFDNPVEIEFTEEGEMLGTVNILYPNRGDCLMHWVEGGVYPREDQQDCIAEFKWTGGLLGPIVDMGHVAVSGLMRYRGTHFGPEYKDHLFITEFNTHQVKRAVLKRSGSTFAAELHDFLTCPDGDFHPTDVLEDADGTLLVVDTGAWFLNGCPTSRVSKPEQYGAIYRVRKTNGAIVEDPRGKQIDWRNADWNERHAHLLGGRPCVTERAIEELAETFDENQRLEDQGKEPLVGTIFFRPFPELFARQLYALSRSRRIDTLDGAVDAVEFLLDQEHSGVELGSALAVLTSRSWSQPISSKISAEILAHMQSKEIPYIRMFLSLAATRCLDRKTPVLTFDVQSIQRVAALAEHKDFDRTAEHSLIVALSRQLHTEGLLAVLGNGSSAVQRVALIALDQLDDSPLTVDMVTPLLATDDAALQRTALEVLARHPGWGTQALGTIRAWLREGELTAERANAVRGVLLAQSGEEDVQGLIAEILVGREAASEVRGLMWEVLQRTTIPTWPEVWNPAVAAALTSREEHIVLPAVRIVQRRGLTDFDAALLSLAENPQRPALQRAEALTAVGPRLTAVSAAQFELLASFLTAETEAGVKLAAARALSVLPLNGKQLSALSDHLEAAGPLVTSTLLKAFERSTDDDVGAVLVGALRKASVADALSPDEVSALVRRYSPFVQQLALPLVKQLGIDPAAQTARLAELSPLVDGGDAKAGERVFFGKRANCSACHGVAGKGSRIGPDLSRIGQSRTGRDLLEAIVYPSASFVNGYRPYVVALSNGQTHQGVIAAETTDAITLRTQDLQEIRVLRADIEEQKESSTSIMPKGLDTQLTADELRNLLAFLQSRK